jgi:hypothetical protein
MDNTRRSVELNLLSGPKIKSTKIKNKFSRFLQKVELNLLSGPKIVSAKIKNKFSRFLCGIKCILIDFSRF